jgi:hypothetical protein
MLTCDCIRSVSADKTVRQETEGVWPARALCQKTLASYVRGAARRQSSVRGAARASGAAQPGACGARAPPRRAPARAGGTRLVCRRPTGNCSSTAPCTPTAPRRSGRDEEQHCRQLPAGRAAGVSRRGGPLRGGARSRVRGGRRRDHAGYLGEHHARAAAAAHAGGAGGGVCQFRVRAGRDGPGVRRHWHPARINVHAQRRPGRRFCAPDSLRHGRHSRRPRGAPRVAAQAERRAAGPRVAYAARGARVACAPAAKGGSLSLAPHVVRSRAVRCRRRPPAPPWLWRRSTWTAPTCS